MANLAEKLRCLFPGIDLSPDSTECVLAEVAGEQSIVSWGRAEFVPSAEDLEQAALQVAKSRTRDAIDALRDFKKQAGITYVWPDTLTGLIQTRDQTDLLNISGQVTAAIVLKSQGVTAPVLWFIDEANVQHPLTPDEAIIMGMAVQSGIAALVSHARELKNAVSKLPTLADVNAFDITQGW